MTKVWTDQLADSLTIAKLMPPESLDALLDLCGAVRFSILKTPPTADPNHMLGVSVLQLYQSAIELTPTASHPAVPDRESLRTRSQILNAVNELVAWCESQPDENTAPPKTGTGTVNQRMAEILLKNPDCIGWTRYEWAQHLGRSEGAVQGTETWERIKTLRLAERFTRAKPRDRRRRPKKVK
jgi:hypothetical protein